MTSRRAFLSAALALASARLAAQDKASKVHRIGVLAPVPLQANAANMDQLRKGLKELGYSEGSNLAIEYLSAEGRSERFTRLAGELVRHNVALIVTSGTPATLAAKNASAGRIPVVTATVVDPVETKVVASLERPGGNVTGVAIDTAELEAKRLDLLRALAPGNGRARRDHGHGQPGVRRGLEGDAAGRAEALGMELVLIDVRKPEEVARGFAAAAARKTGAAVVRVRLPHRRQPARDRRRRGAEHRLPAMYYSRQFVDVGGLASYGVNTPQMYYRAAVFVDKILKGAKPAELPMERPTRFELVLNRLTAHRLGLVIPPDLLPQVRRGRRLGQSAGSRADYFSAASTARFAITVIRCARYSGLACRSLFSPSAFTLMFATDSGANFALSAFSMSAWRNAQAPAPVTPTRTLPPKSATNTPTMAKREAGFLNFMYAARLGTGKRHRGDQLARLERGLVQALEELVGFDLALVGGDGRAQAERRRRVVGRRVVVGERAADRAHVAHLAVADRCRRARRAPGSPSSRRPSRRRRRGASSRRSRPRCRRP